MSYGKTQVESMISGFLVFVLEVAGSYQVIEPEKIVSTPVYGPKLKCLVDEYVAENQRSGRWSLRTFRDYRHCLEFFLRFFGDQTKTNSEPAYYTPSRKRCI